MNNLVGQRGENLLFLALTKRLGPNGNVTADGKSLFLPAFLGEKWPTADYYVEVQTTGKRRPYFFIQVKATTQGYLAKPKRLKVALTKEKMARLLAIPAPTYLVGVDEINERVYIRSIHSTNTPGLSSLRTSHALTPRNLVRLRDEVTNFWRTSGQKPSNSVFNI